jgi:recombination protein RecA
MVACPECGREFKTGGALTQHIKRDHSADPLAGLRASIPGSPRPGGAISSRPMVAAPSGIPSVDYAMGIGGLLRGSIAEVFGPSQTGKTFMAMVFAAYAQQQGGKAGYMDGERALNPTFLGLVPGLDIEALEYGMPPDGNMTDERGEPVYPPAVREKMLKDGWDGSGEAALESSRRFINSGQFDVWAIDSVHSLVPRAKLGLPIGHPGALAAIARLMSEACPIMEHEISRTKTLCVFVNHVKSVPNSGYGKDWSKPGGSALDYYAAAQLHVTQGMPYYKQPGGRKIGHVVKVKVYKNKAGQPHGSAEFDLFYGEGMAKGPGATAPPARYVTTGVDIASSWLSVLTEEKQVVWAGNRYVDANGEAIGSRGDVLEALADPGSHLRKVGQAIVYPTQYQAAA